MVERHKLPYSIMAGKADQVEFWITNVSDRNVSLLDLGLTVRAYSTVNLMDSKHYRGITLELLHRSQDTGSLKTKSNLIKVRKVPPADRTAVNIFSEPEFLAQQNQHMPSRANSTIQAIRPHFDELVISDELFAEENSDTVETDRKPLIPVK